MRLSQDFDTNGHSLGCAPRRASPIETNHEQHAYTGESADPRIRCSTRDSRAEAAHSE